MLSDGTYGIIQSVRVSLLAVPETTYNFEVADYHTYYVGSYGVCVHNSQCGGRGANNPKTKEAAARGRKIHENYDYGPDVLKEQTIKGYGRADGINYKLKIVYELKPDNPRAIARGLKQLERYLKGLGKEWTGRIITYK